MKDLEQKFIHIQKLYENKTVSEKEYATLIKNLGLEQEIVTNAKELQKKNDVYDAMMKAVAFAKTIL